MTKDDQHTPTASLHAFVEQLCAWFGSEYVCYLVSGL